MIRPFNPLDSNELKAEHERWKKIRASLTTIGKETLTAFGVQMASWAVQDYRARSEGNQAAGVVWAPITRSAAVTRLRARAPWQDDSASLASLHEQEKPLKEQLRKKLPKGRDAKKAKQRGRIAADFQAKSKEWQAIKRKRKTIKDRRKRNIEKEHASAKIGIDTGRLVNSIVYGVPELASVRAPKTSAIVGQGGNNIAFGMTKGVFRLTPTSVTIGTQMQYADHFDRLRPIFPDGFLAGNRLDSLKSIADKVLQSKIERGLA